MSTSDRPILAGVDGSAPSTQAVRWAAAEAALRRRHLDLVHAYTSPATAASLAGLAYGWSETTLREQAEAVVAEAVAQAREVAPGVTGTGRAVYGPVVPTLIELSANADLVVVGDRGHGGFASLLLGSVASALAAHALAPAVVVRAPAVGTGVVVGMDGSPAADAALAFAFDEAARRGCDLLVVHSWEPSAPPWRPTELPPSYEVEELTAAHTRLVHDWVRPWREKFPEVPVQIRVSDQRPAAALIAASADAALVVVGSRGRGGFSGLLLGSVSQQLVHHAASPVVVAHTTRTDDRPVPAPAPVR